MSHAEAPATKRSWGSWIGAGCALLLLAVCCTSAAVGSYFYLRPTASSQQPAVEYVLDASPRMNQSTEEGTRIEVARGVLAEIVRPANPSLNSGLRVFGSGAVSQPCQDTQLVVPFSTSNQNKIASQLEAVTAGSTSNSDLSEAMISAIRDLASKGGPQSLVVVTGGADDCNPQTGELIAQEAQRAGVDLKTYVVGFQVASDESQVLNNQVGSIPGAELQTAEDATSLRDVLASIQRRVDATAGGQAAPPTVPATLGPITEVAGDYTVSFGVAVDPGNNAAFVNLPASGRLHVTQDGNQVTIHFDGVDPSQTSVTFTGPLLASATFSAQTSALVGGTPDISAQIAGGFLRTDSGVVEISMTLEIGTKGELAQGQTVIYAVTSQ
jgi:hypothetical protein